MSPKDTDASANASTACRERSASTTQPSRSIERYLPFSAVKSEKQLSTMQVETRMQKTAFTNLKYSVSSLHWGRDRDHGA